jgi:hypothetical protein
MVDSTLLRQLIEAYLTTAPREQFSPHFHMHGTFAYLYIFIQLPGRPDLPHGQPRETVACLLVGSTVKCGRSAAMHGQNIEAITTIVE